MSSQKVAVLVFASLAGATLFLFQNCSAVSSKSSVGSWQKIERDIANDQQDNPWTQKLMTADNKKTAQN